MYVCTFLHTRIETSTHTTDDATPSHHIFAKFAEFSIKSWTKRLRQPPVMFYTYAFTFFPICGALFSCAFGGKVKRHKFQPNMHTKDLNGKDFVMHFLHSFQEDFARVFAQLLLLAADLHFLTVFSHKNAVKYLENSLQMGPVKLRATAQYEI